MSTERIVVDGVARLPQFSHAGVAGDLVFVAGTLGTTEGLELAEGVAAQTTHTLENMGEILAGSGAGWADVVKVSVYLADMVDFAAMNEAYGAYFHGTPPARITIGGAELAMGARVEMECIARRPAVTREPVTREPLPPRQSGFVDHDGERLHYELVGDAPGPPLVLGHGAGGNHAVWCHQVAHFARHRRVLTWDHRGFGRSSDHADRSGPEVAAGDLLAVLEHLGIGRADLVGQSMGGWTVVGAALRRPGVARSIVLADSLGGFTSQAISTALAGPRAVDASPLGGSTLGVHPALDAAFSRREPARAHLYQSLGEMGTADATTVVARLMETTHDAGEAAAIRCPVLCVVGDRDPLFPPAAVRAVTDLLPDARLVEIPGCGHSPYWEAPETWNAVVGRFLVSLDEAGES